MTRIMSVKTIKGRVNIAREAIMRCRRKGISTSGTIIVGFGCVGLLDFVDTGDPDRILEHHFKTTVQIIIAELEKGEDENW